MPKIHQVDDEPSQPPTKKGETNLPNKNSATPFSPESVLEFTLSSGLNAVFRLPKAVDLITAEKVPGAITRNESGTGITTATFYREIGKLCCVKWGKINKIPGEIKSGDDSLLTEFFLKLLNVKYINDFNEGNFVVNVEEESTENEAGDLFVPKRVTLTCGDEITFRQVLNKDIEQIERLSFSSAITSVEQYLKLASQTVTKFNGKPTSWAEMQQYFYELTGEDYIRVYLTLRSF